MKLRFLARPGHLCSLPGPRVVGTMPRYVGRRVRIIKDVIVNAIQPEPEEFDSGSPEGRRLLHRMIVDRADPPLIPADEMTARACGVPFKQPKKAESSKSARGAA